MPASETEVAHAQAVLAASGFPCGALDGRPGPLTRAAVRRFQLAWAGGKGGQELLVADGLLGPRTLAALGDLPWLSPHFTVDELRSRGDRTCYVRSPLVRALERLREADGKGALPIISAYRDPARNAAVGGASDSTHLHGLAADLGRLVPLGTVLGLRLFSGVGTRGGLASHVDLRHLREDPDRSRGSVAHPARWVYGG